MDLFGTFGKRRHEAEVELTRLQTKEEFQTQKRRELRSEIMRLQKEIDGAMFIISALINKIDPENGKVFISDMARTEAPGYLTVVTDVIRGGSWISNR